MSICSLVLFSVTPACGPAGLEDEVFVEESSSFDDGKADGFAGTFKGIVFSTTEASLTLDFVNRAEVAVIASESGVGARTAEAIVAARPFATVARLSTVPGVGSATLTKLKVFAQRWAQTSALSGSVQCGLGGKLDAVVFSGTEECQALDLANSAGFLQLGGIDLAARRLIYDRRPWRALRDVSATSGIGSGAMRQLRTLTAGWVVGHSGRLDTIERVLRDRPSSPDGKTPQLSLESARVLSRVAGTPCIWMNDARAGLESTGRIQVCAPAGFDAEPLFRRTLAAKAVVQVRAHFKLRGTMPYLQGYATDFLRVTAEPLP